MRRAGVPCKPGAAGAGSGLLRGDVVTQLDLLVALVHEDQARLVAGDLGGVELHEGRNDDQIAHGSAACGRAVATSGPAAGRR